MKTIIAAVLSALIILLLAACSTSYYSVIRVACDWECMSVEKVMYGPEPAEEIPCEVFFRNINGDVLHVKYAGCSYTPGNHYTLFIR